MAEMQNFSVDAAHSTATLAPSSNSRTEGSHSTLDVSIDAGEASTADASPQLVSDDMLPAGMTRLPLPCVNCKRAHSACDRKPQGCTTCKIRGLTCGYDIRVLREKLQRHENVEKRKALGGSKISFTANSADSSPQNVNTKNRIDGSTAEDQSQQDAAVLSEPHGKAVHQQQLVRSSVTNDLNNRTQLADLLIRLYYEYCPMGQPFMAPDRLRFFVNWQLDSLDDRSSLFHDSKSIRRHILSLPVQKLFQPLDVFSTADKGGGGGLLLGEYALLLSLQSFLFQRLGIRDVSEELLQFSKEIIYKLWFGFDLESYFGTDKRHGVIEDIYVGSTNQISSMASSDQNKNVLLLARSGMTENQALMWLSTEHALETLRFCAAAMGLVGLVAGGAGNHSQTDLYLSNLDYYRMHVKPKVDVLRQLRNAFQQRDAPGTTSPPPSIRVYEGAVSDASIDSFSVYVQRMIFHHKAMLFGDWGEETVDESEDSRSLRHYSFAHLDNDTRNRLRRDDVQPVVASTSNAANRVISYAVAMESVLNFPHGYVPAPRLITTYQRFNQHLDVQYNPIDSGAKYLQPGYDPTADAPSRTDIIMLSDAIMNRHLSIQVVKTFRRNLLKLLILAAEPQAQDFFVPFVAEANGAAVELISPFQIAEFITWTDVRIRELSDQISKLSRCPSLSLCSSLVVHGIANACQTHTVCLQQLLATQDIASNPQIALEFQRLVQMLCFDLQAIQTLRKSAKANIVAQSMTTAAVRSDKTKRFEAPSLMIGPMDDEGITR